MAFRSIFKLNKTILKNAAFPCQTIVKTSPAVNHHLRLFSSEGEFLVILGFCKIILSRDQLQPLFIKCIRSSINDLNPSETNKIQMIIRMAQVLCNVYHEIPLFSVNKTSPAGPQLISKLFPQTAVTEDLEAAQEQKKQDEEEKKEKESSWKRMKFGYASRCGLQKVKKYLKISDILAVSISSARRRLALECGQSMT
jgi:hypothetical protein